jgi:hypothetical protein
MRLVAKIFISIVLGAGIAAMLLMISGSEGVSKPVKDVLLWNVNLAVKLAGTGPLLRYNSQGEPMYEGTPVHMFFGLLGLLSTFPIYMIVSFLFLTGLEKLMDKRAGNLQK